MKILIVDDETISRKILVSKMKSLGTCVAVEDSKKALAELEVAQAKEAPFDVITLDVSMPGMDGKQMLKHIRRQEIQKKIPKKDRVKIIMVTAQMNMSTIKACIKLGCDGYLTKPVSRVQLLQKFGNLGFDTTESLNEEEKETAHTAAVADIINRFYSGKIAMPVFPHIVQEVEALISGDDPSIEDLSKIVEKDIVISTKLISIANSPLYKGMDIVDNLNGALLRLGMKTTQGVVSAVAAKHLFDSDNTTLKTELDRLWIHSFAVGTLGRHLGEAAGSDKLENIFLMGIIHDIGKMLLMKAFVDIHPEVSIADRELRLAIHEIHTTFGAALIKKMRFSKGFVQVAEFHHWNAFDKDTEQELLVVSLADHLAYELGFAFLDSEDRKISKIKPPEEQGDEETLENDRKETLERLSELSAMKLLGLTPQVVLTIGEKIRPMITESAQAF
ncbi:MAG: HDOD domain-containing protein [Desulfobacterales bacterium]|nr:HDOD domain-containing protein [Desulfobacterales bacterium]